MPPIDSPLWPSSMPATTEYTEEMIKNLSMKDWESIRAAMLLEVSKLNPMYQGSITIPNSKYIESLTCMWCAAPFPTMEELEAHEADPH